MTAGRICKVLFDYEPENLDELQLSVGQSVNFIKEVEDGWWEGQLNGKAGMFPSNFVEMVEEDIAYELFDDSSQGEKVTSCAEKKGKKVVGVGFGNIFQGGKIKLKNFKKEDKLPEREQTPARPPALKPANEFEGAKNGAKERAVVKYTYKAEQPDELSLKVGEVIRILDKYSGDEGWWRGEVDNRVGMFPDNFVELLPPIEQAPRPPTKPPPPCDKRSFPKAQHTSSRGERNAPDRKTSEPCALTKRLPAPPPVSMKPAVSHNVKDLCPILPKRRAAVDEESGSIYDDIGNEETGFEAVENNSQKLSHITATRSKGPKKRPPSAIITISSEAEMVASNATATEADDGDVGQDGPTDAYVELVEVVNSTKIGARSQKHLSSDENVKRKVDHSNRDLVADEKDSHPTGLSVLKPKRSTVHVGSVTAGSVDTVAQYHKDVRREVPELRAGTVSRREYDELRSEHKHLADELENMRVSTSKRIARLTSEVDECRKLHAGTEIEVDRIRKLLSDSRI